MVRHSKYQVYGLSRATAIAPIKITVEPARGVQQWALFAVESGPALGPVFSQWESDKLPTVVAGGREP